MSLTVPLLQRNRLTSILNNMTAVKFFKITAQLHGSEVNHAVRKISQTV